MSSNSVTFQDSFRNILFGKDYDERWYKEVVEACQLNEVRDWVLCVSSD